MKDKLKNTITIVVYDILMIPVAWFIANWVFYGDIVFSIKQSSIVLQIFPFLIIVQAFFYWYFGLYRGIWRFASTPDLIRIIKAVFFANIVSLAIIFFITRLNGIPRAIFPLYSLVLIFLLGGSRLIYRYAKDRKYLKFKSKHVLIVGAGSAGEILVRDLLRSTNHDYCPVGFIDDAKDKQGREIHRIRVLGACEDIAKISKQYEINLAIIALPSANAKQMRRIVEYCNAARIPFQTLPSLGELASGKVTINTFREVAIEDLLGREQVELDWQEIYSNIKDQVVLVSGGGGSIGSELCRQIANLNPKSLVVIENSELNLYHLQREISEKFSDLNFIFYLGSVTDKLLVDKIFKEIKPQIIFHAAAYKHVPILENQTYIAVHNNVLGTKIMSEAAIEFAVDKFVLISTDKAVCPANIMGATKRFAEIACQYYNQQNAATKFIIVRFGNVLGSSGSVVPLFKKQLALGGPITVTHPEITRFFMTIPEAVQLILQAYVLGEGGEIFVLDMGEPIKIKYLAEQMIRLSGKEPCVDVEIVYSGLRLGEKLHEELFYQNEEIIRTKHQKIFQAKSEFPYNRDLIAGLKNLEKILLKDDFERVNNLLRKLILAYNVGTARELSNKI